jgi:hypothetical protein
MPLDPTNAPFPRERAATDVAAPEATADTALKLESILLEEYNYAGVTAYQAQEDRARVFNLYLLLVGILGSALAAVYQLGDTVKQYTHPLAFLMLVLSGILGVVFFLKLIRLRQAFRDSLIAMNRIKEYYIRRFIPRVPDIGDAFHWRLRTIPRGERLGSLTFLVCFTVALLGSICFAGGAIVGLDYARSAGWLGWLGTWSDAYGYVLAVLVLLISLLLHTRYYQRRLSPSVDTRQLLQEEQAIGPTAER